MTKEVFFKQAIVTSASIPKRQTVYRTPATAKEGMQGFGYKVSIFENELPNTKVSVVSKVDQLIHEKPFPDFATLINYKNLTPELKTISGMMTDLIVGTDMVINSDDDEATRLCEDFINDINLFDKIKSHTDIALTTGFGLLARVKTKEGLVNVEEFDVSTIKEIGRDVYGNVKAYIQRLNDGVDKPVTDVENYVPLIFERNGRAATGLSFFHAMAVPRQVGNRWTRPLVEALWSLDDVIIGTLENFAYPVEYHTYEGADEDTLEEEAQKLRESKPGDRFVISRQHEIDRREPSKANWDPFVNRLSKDMLQQGTGFPLDMLTGDFTSRASSETADSFFMRRIRSYQQYLTKVVKRDILEYFLINHPSGKWNSREKINKVNLQVEFETETPENINLDRILQFKNSGVITVNETREYLKGIGMDLFDDDVIQQDEDMKRQQAEDSMNQQFDSKKDFKKAKKAKEETLKRIWNSKTE